MNISSSLQKSLPLFKTAVYLIIYSVLVSCSSEETISNQGRVPTLNIATAANTQFVIHELATIFEEEQAAKVNLIIGSSGKLTAQIKQGAPFDLFLSANMKYPERLFQEGYTQNAPAVYANGQLVLWTVADELLLDKELTILKESTIHNIGIANPKNAPYGEEAIRALQYFEVYDTVKSKLVYGESIGQTTQFIASGNCEVGITAKSIVSSPIMQGRGKWIDIPSVAYQPILQGVIITKYGAKHHAAPAQAFYDFLFTKKAQQVFKNFGYTIPKNSISLSKSNK